jgi:glycosyltransferase involved in cell wall biosynthesis
MIVKNEAAIIERCLKAAAPHINYWIICDTGSTDGTQTIIRETLKGIPGELHEVPWINFGANRTQAMDLARDKADYTLMPDADYELTVRLGFDWNSLAEDVYYITLKGDTAISQYMLFANRKPWRWIDPVHERAVCDEPHTIGILKDVAVVNHNDGSNERDDLAILMPQYEADPGNPRTVFYIAQTWLARRELEKALSWYERRLKLESSFEEETWYAMLMRARLMQQVGGESPDRIRDAYFHTFCFRPHRLEPIAWLAQYCRLQGDYEAAFAFSSIAGTGARYPEHDLLFIDRRIYDYILLYEFGLAAAVTRRIGVAKAAYARLIESPAPEVNRSSLASAIQWAEGQ